jgi:hypothetical protein
LVIGACDPPYDDAVVKLAMDDEAIGVVATVIALDIAPEVDVMTGEACESSIAERPLSSARFHLLLTGTARRPEC